MTTLLIQVADDNKELFIRDLLAEYDFIEILNESQKPVKNSNTSNLLDLAGLWKDYDIDINDLRKKA